MKKLLSLLGVGIIAAMWSGCGVTNPASSVTIKIDGIGAVVVGGASGQVTGSIQTDSLLTSVSMKVLSGSTDVSSDFTVSYTSAYLNKKSVDLNTDMSTTVAAKTGTASGTYTLSITAEAGSITSTTTKDFGVTGGQTGTPVDTATLVAGSNQAIAGSSIDLDEPAIYNSAASVANVSKIDLCYSYTNVAGFTAGDYLFSPDQAQSSGYTYTSGWTTTPNTTAFYLTNLTAAQYNAITTKEQVAALWTAPAAPTPYALCTAGEVFIAKTDQSAIVLIYISAQTPGATGTISLKIAK
jgi:hypothetical protein